MQRSILILLCVAGCAPVAAPTTQPSASTSASYRATGTEPFWSVTLADGRMRYDDASGQRIDVAAPPARPSFNGERHVTNRLTLDVTHTPCSDGMSDRRYPDTVMVIADGRELRGCGMAGETSAIEGREWRVNAIGGEAPGGPQPATLTFSEGRLSGTTGCNRVMGRYTIEGDRLTLDGVGTTRMACPGPAMTQEAAIVAALRGPLTIVRGKDGVMLTGDGNASLTLLPVRP